MQNDDTDLVISILNAFQAKSLTIDVPLLSYSQLYSLLAPKEIDFIHRISTEADFELEKQVAASSTLITPSDDQYSKRFVRVNRQLYNSFANMQRRVFDEIGQELCIISGYRSPAYQTMIFLRELWASSFNPVTAQRLAKLPSESQHCNYPFHALDISLVEPNGQAGSIKNPSTHFENTEAYRWLIRYAGLHDFILSYPEHNRNHTDFEPWHWYYTGVQ